MENKQGLTVSQKPSDLHLASAKAVIIEATLVKYWTEKLHAQVWAQMLKDWLSTLDPFSPAEIEAACRQHVKQHPTQRPNEGHIYAIAAANRIADRKRLALPAPQERRPEPSEESKRRVAEMVANAGMVRGMNK